MKKISYLIVILSTALILSACSPSAIKSLIGAGVRNATSSDEGSNTGNLRKDIETLVEDVELERKTAEIYAFEDVDLSTEEIEGNFDVIMLAGTMNIVNRKTGESGRDFHRATAVVKKNGEVITIKDKDQKIAKKIYNSYDAVYHEKNGKVLVNELRR